MHSISNLVPVRRSFNLTLLRSRLQANRYDMTEKRSLSLYTNRKFTTAKVKKKLDPTGNWELQGFVSDIKHMNIL